MEPKFQNEVLVCLMDFLPKNVEIEDLVGRKFGFNKDNIVNDARDEGYEIVASLPKDAKLDAYCVVSDYSIKFFKRVYYKGKPGTEFKLDRDAGPAIYSEKEISWWSSGELHRDNNLPAYLTFYELTWNVNGKWHRGDKGFTAVNLYRGFLHHNNHDLYKKSDGINTYIFAGWQNGVGQWKMTKM